MIRSGGATQARSTRNLSPLLCICLVTAALSAYLGIILLGFAVTPNAVYATTIGSLTAFALVVALRRWLRGRLALVLRPGGRAARHAPGLDDFWLPVAATAVLAFLAGETAALWFYEHFGSASYDKTAQARAEAPWPAVLVFVLIAAPLGEEAVFRGLLHPLVRRTLRFRAGVAASLAASPLPALVVATVLFALMHGNPVQIIAVVPLSLVLGMVYERTQNLRGCIAVHIGFNVATFVVPPASLEQLVVLPVVLALLVAFAVCFWAVWDKSLAQPPAECSG